MLLLLNVCLSVRTPSGERILVRLLLSIDRSGSQSDAESTVDLAGEFHAEADPVVVGIDFSGNPTVSSFRAFEHHFVRARALGLRSTVHIGEKEGDEDDLDAVLFGFRPQRIGHVVCLLERHTAELLARPVPIEICPTSNVKTRIVRSLEHHPFGTWRAGAAARNNNADGDSTSQAAAESTESATEAVQSASSSSRYPLVICTDDSGVFNITLSSEVLRLAEAFHMDRDDILQLETDALEHAFVGEDHKKGLRDIFERFRARMVQEDGSAAAAAAAAAPVPAVAAAASSASAPSDPRPVAILTCAEEAGTNASDRALMDAFRAAGLAAEHVVWNDPSVRWSAYRGVVIRSIWDYHLSDESVAGLLRVLAGVEAAGVPLLNALDTVRWNHSKAYLRELAELGVAAVDSMWVDSLADEREQIVQRLRERAWNDCVIKPQVSASGNLTFRFALQPDAAAPLPSLDAVLEQCVASGVQRWLVQAFCPEVMSEGEWSFVFLNGAYSHCVLSTPAGARSPQAGPAWVDPASPASPALSCDAADPAKHPNSFMVQQTHGGSFRYRDPDAALIEQARSILHSTRYGRESLYARVDCIRRGDQLLLSELELIEPELFGRGVDGFQRKFVDAIEKRLAQAAAR